MQAKIVINGFDLTDMEGWLISEPTYFPGLSDSAPSIPKTKGNPFSHPSAVGGVVPMSNRKGSSFWGVNMYYYPENYEDTKDAYSVLKSIRELFYNPEHLLVKWYPLMDASGVIESNSLFYQGVGRLATDVKFLSEADGSHNISFVIEFREGELKTPWLRKTITGTEAGNFTMPWAPSSIQNNSDWIIIYDSEDSVPTQPFSFTVGSTGIFTGTNNPFSYCNGIKRVTNSSLASLAGKGSMEYSDKLNTSTFSAKQNSVLFDNSKLVIKCPELAERDITVLYRLVSI